MDSAFEITVKLFQCFIFYSFIGWAYESFVWAICEKKQFINRGFLLGPLCPIYGLVCLLDYYLLREIHHSVGIFCTAMVVCCCAEYFISWAFEKLFHARWWDYSNYAFNINGRISLYSGLFFGAAGLLLVKVVHPAVLKLLEIIPFEVQKISALCLLIALIVDIIVTTVAMANFNSKIKKYHDIVTGRMEKQFDYLNEHKESFSDSVIAQQGSKILVRFESFNEKMIEKEDELKEIQSEKADALKEKLLVFKRAELHFIKAFPDFKVKFGAGELNELREKTLTKVYDSIKTGIKKIRKNHE